MHVAGLGKLSFDEMLPSWDPFFSQFKVAVQVSDRKKIMQGILEYSSRMIAKELKRQKKIYSKHRD